MNMFCTFSFIVFVVSLSLVHGTPSLWEKAKTSDLIGFCAFRTASIFDADGKQDTSFIMNPVLIVSVSHRGDIQVLVPDAWDHMNDKMLTLGSMFNDENWVRAPNPWCRDIETLRRIATKVLLSSMY